MPSNALRWAALAALALFILLLIPAALAQNATSTQNATPVEEFKLPDGTTTIDAMTLDGQGNLWLAQSSPAALYKFDASAKTFEKHDISGADNALFKGMSAEGDGYIWIADEGDQKIYGYDVDKNKFYNFTFPPGLKLDPSDVVSDGTYLWLACNMELGRIDINSNDLKDYYVDKYTANLADLVKDRSGNVWFVEYSTGKVGGYIRMDDQVRLFPMPGSDSAPTTLDIDSQGRLWIIESGTNKLGTFDTSRYTAQEFDMPVLDGAQVYPKRVAVDGDDNVWLTDLPNGRVVKYYPSKNAFVPVGLNGSKVYPTFIEADGDNIWILESGTGKLALLQTGPYYGLATAFTPTASPTPTTAPGPTPTPTPTPKPSPGFELPAALMALALVAKKLSR